MKMKPSQLITFLVEAIKARLPVLVVGGPGTGKSEITAQAASIAGAKMILSHPVVEDPTDVKGLPWIGKDAKTATFLPFGNLAEAMAAKKLTVWDLEDLGQALPAMQASYMQLLLAREVNGHKLPDCVTFVATTNRRTDRAGVAGILEPVKSRFLAIIELEPDLDEWCQWYLAQPNMPPEIAAFLRFRPKLLYAFAPTADITNSPLPRTWVNVARILNLHLPQAIEASGIAGAVGEGAAVEFLGFLRMYRQLPSIDAILMDPASADIPTEPNVLYAIVTGLATKASEQNFGRIVEYAERLVEKATGEFATLLIRDVTRRCPELQTTPEFAGMMSGELGQLTTGIVA